MKSLGRWGVAICAALMLPAVASAADMYLQIKGVAGEPRVVACAAGACVVTDLASGRYSVWVCDGQGQVIPTDISLEYLLGPEYEPVTFPDDYWPPVTALASEQQWHDTLDAYRRDLDRVEAFVRDADLDLYTASTYVWEPAHTPLRTVLVMADHAAYHGGELGILRQVMGLWAPQRVDHFTLAASITQNLGAEPSA